MDPQRGIAALLAPEVNHHARSEHVESLLMAGELPPELATGHQLIDFEHRFLLGSIVRLRKLCIDPVKNVDCSGCSQSGHAGCEDQLISLLGDLFAFILEHFKTEEAIMRDSLLLMVDRDLCQAHMEDHAAISAKVQEVVASLESGRIVQRIRDLEELLDRWLTHHIALHDSMLARWMGRDDSLFKGL